MNIKKKTLSRPHHFGNKECSDLQNCLTLSLFIEVPVSNQSREEWVLVVSMLPLILRFLDWIFNYSNNVILFVCNIFGLNKIIFSTKVVIKICKFIDRKDKRSNNDQRLLLHRKLTIEDP